MGLLISKIMQRFGAMQDKKILMLGLDAAGKTTVLYKLKLNETVTTIPTVGFNVEGIETRNNVRMTMWDVGGQDKIRKLWKHYFLNTDAIVFVVDSADRERIFEASNELESILASDEIRDSCKCVLVYANKQDLPNTMPTSEIVEKMRLSQHRHLEWYIQPSVATTGDGIYEGIDWMTNVLTKK